MTLSGFIPDRRAQTVRIPVYVSVLGVTQRDGSALPEITEPADGELVVPAHALADQGRLGALLTMSESKVLDKGTTLMFAVNPDRVPSELRAHLVPPTELGLTTYYHFVPAELRDAVWLLRRGDAKKAVLRGGACWIPSLTALARSVNHALGLVSEAFEPSRLSHTGNVFLRVYSSRQSGQRATWSPLDSLR
jgi:hypothetical protein